MEEVAWPRVSTLSTGCGVTLAVRGGRLVLSVVFSEKWSSASDDRSLTAREWESLLLMTDRALARPGDGWDVSMTARRARVRAFDPATDSLFPGGPGGPGVVRYEVKGLRFLLGPDGCRKFRSCLEEALSLMTVSKVMES
jgi:hypothetical protein